jgi:CMP-N-acetylneuraminic acid synthetase
MPPLKDTESTQKEGRIALAIQAFKQGQFKSLLAATQAYDVPYSTVYERVNGHPARRDLRPPNQKLTDTEESTLVQWILSIDERGLLLRADSVQQMANLLLQK